MDTGYLSYIHGITLLSVRYPDDVGETQIKEILLTPPPPTLLTRVEDPSFRRQYHEISSLLTDRPGLLSLFHLNLVTALLQAPEPVFKISYRFLMNHLDFNALLGFVPPPENPGSWCCMPVVLTSSGRTYIRYITIGKVTSAPLQDRMPSWAVPLFDPASSEAVRTAARAARALCRPAEPAGLFCFPLTLPAPPAHQDHTPRFQGKSLGLPLALGFAAVLHKHSLPRTLAATGEITDQGNILPVSHLDLKKKGIEDHGFNALIYPATGTGLPTSGTLTCLPVSTLNQAYTLFSLYSPESTENLMLLSACLKDPGVLAENIGALPCAWLQWITRHHLIKPAIKALQTDPHLFAVCTDRFEKKANAFKIDHARAIQALVPAQAIRQHRRNLPLSVFRWCTASLSLANHCGDTTDACRWEEKGSPLADTISKMDLALVANFYNHALVARHNRYRFSPDLPPALTELLALLEIIYGHKCDFGCKTDPVLGRLYGTLTQHYAFCGPGCLNQTRTFFHNAVQAMGLDQVPEYREDWLRQHNYMTYALLDAGDLTGARQSLATYFNQADMVGMVNHLCNPDERFTPWHIALAARYFVRDQSHPARTTVFRHLLRRFQSGSSHAHPWQLIAFNLGRLALNIHDLATGQALLLQSIDFCFSSFAGPTIQVMALLPISFLPDSALPASRIQKTWEQKIRSAASHLDPAHFSPVLDTPFDEIRHQIRQATSTWFPFTYR
jgi:hypothetical protein